ncbi:MAG: hypothetical protein CBC13_05415 [Planctomycetia bacterium TMED53]|nr:MAG: hypothetical protein CBC13_05415 [Planctomycetia bacterium TMED53]
MTPIYNRHGAKLFLILILIFGLSNQGSKAADIPFVRGDANVDGAVNLSDGIWLLQHLFQSGPGGSCFAARDFNADGQVDLSDAFSIIQFQLLDGGAPAHPYPYCGESAIGDCQEYSVCPEVAPLTVSRDELGVWFIEGGSLFDLYEAFGYEVTVDRLWQMEYYRRLCRGQLSEVFGSDQLSTDISIRILGYSDEEYLAGFETISERAQELVAGYLDGINRRIEEVLSDPNLLPYEFHDFGFLPAPWTVIDIMALQVTLLRNFDSEALATHQLNNAVLLAELEESHPEDALAMFNDLRWLDDPEAPTMIPPAETPSGFLSSGDIPEAPVPVPGQYKIENLRALRDGVHDIFEGTRERISQIGTPPKMGSYAWVVSGDLTESGLPIIYAGPQMGFTAPALVVEGSLRGAGIDVSGMALAGLPGIIIGRTPRHAWSGQVAHAHTVDIYLEEVEDIFLHRVEVIAMGNDQFFNLPIYRSVHGPIVSPIILSTENLEGPVAAWKYAHWEKELRTVDVNLDYILARNMEDFGKAMDQFCVSLHVCYADRRGNVGYWMSGLDPVRVEGADPRLPQLGDGSMEWTTPVTYKERVTTSNPERGWIAGWNNKAGAGEAGGANPGHAYGRFHRAHAMQDRLESAVGQGKVDFEYVRDLALEISATDCCSLGNNGGNKWFFVDEFFTQSVEADLNPERLAALELLEAWDGYFIEGGEQGWVEATVNSDAWVLQDRWIKNMLELVFEDELETQTLGWNNQGQNLLFNVMLRALPGSQPNLVNQINWFEDRSGGFKPTDPAQLVVLALDLTLADLGTRPWNLPRATIDYVADSNLGTVWSSPWLNRSTYAQVVEVGSEGPVRIESMIPLGQSGDVRLGPNGEPIFGEYYFGFTEIFDGFLHRDFPLFSESSSD